MGNIYHEWNGTVLTITSDSGTSSADLKGDKGDIGVRGAQGAPGCLVSPAGATIPAVNESDNGKILQVVDGAWAAAENSGGSKINLGVKNYKSFKESLPIQEDVPFVNYGAENKVNSELVREAILAWLADNNTPIFLDAYNTIPATKIETGFGQIWGAYFYYELYFETIGVMIHATAVECDDSGNPIEIDINTAKEIITYSFALAENAGTSSGIIMKSGLIQSTDGNGSPLSESTPFTVSIYDELEAISSSKATLFEVQIFTTAMGDVVNMVTFPCLVSESIPTFACKKDGIVLDTRGRQLWFYKESTTESAWEYCAGEYYAYFVTK